MDKGKIEFGIPLDSNDEDEIVHSLANNIYKLSDMYYEFIGEAKGMLHGNGHHMAQYLSQTAEKL